MTSILNTRRTAQCVLAESEYLWGLSNSPKVKAEGYEYGGEEEVLAKFCHKLEAKLSEGRLGQLKEPLELPPQVERLIACFEMVNLQEVALEEALNHIGSELLLELGSDQLYRAVSASWASVNPEGEARIAKLGERTIVSQRGKSEYVIRAREFELAPRRRRRSVECRLSDLSHRANELLCRDIRERCWRILSDGPRHGDPGSVTRLVSELLKPGAVLSIAKEGQDRTLEKDCFVQDKLRTGARLRDAIRESMACPDQAERPSGRKGSVLVDDELKDFWDRRNTRNGRDRTPLKRDTRKFLALMVLHGICSRMAAEVLEEWHLWEAASLVMARRAEKLHANRARLLRQIAVLRANRSHAALAAMRELLAERKRLQCISAEAVFTTFRLEPELVASVLDGDDPSAEVRMLAS